MERNGVRNPRIRRLHEESAGLSAAGGLNYQDPDLFRKWYPQFARLGLRNIWEAIVAHWAPNDANRRRHQPECNQEIRKEILNRIRTHEWLRAAS